MSFLRAEDGWTPGRPMGRLPHCLPYLENTEAHCAGPQGP